MVLYGKSALIEENFSLVIVMEFAITRFLDLFRANVRVNKGLAVPFLLIQGCPLGIKTGSTERGRWGNFRVCQIVRTLGRFEP